MQRKRAGNGEVVIDPDWCVVERIIRRRRVPSTATEAAPANRTSVVQYHVKWKGLEYGSSTWFLKRNMTAVDKVRGWPLSLVSLGQGFGHSELKPRVKPVHTDHSDLFTNKLYAYVIIYISVGHIPTTTYCSQCFRSRASSAAFFAAFDSLL